MNALPTITRGTLRSILSLNGIPVGDPEDGEVAHIVSFIDAWGIGEGCTEATSSAAIKRALDDAGIVWTQGNYIMVEAIKVEILPKVRFTGQRAYMWNNSHGWVRIPLINARLGVDEGRFEEITR